MKHLQKLKIELSYDPAVSLLGLYSKEMEMGYVRYLYSNVHCIIIHNRQGTEII